MINTITPQSSLLLKHFYLNAMIIIEVQVVKHLI
jgi:hypothetical protein